jgi:hypothetical protein
MPQVDVAVDDMEHDMARDEVLARAAEIEDEQMLVSVMHGYVTGAVIALVPHVTLESLTGLMDHMKDCARDYSNAIDGAPQ